jgi:hypothetical protein
MLDTRRFFFVVLMFIAVPDTVALSWSVQASDASHLLVYLSFTDCALTWSSCVGCVVARKRHKAPKQEPEPGEVSVSVSS